MMIRSGSQAIIRRTATLTALRWRRKPIRMSIGAFP
jgi:hypothetical protein